MKGFKDTSKTKWICGGYAKGGAVNKVPRNMVESTSARPVRIPLDRAVPTPTERGAIDRGNRAAAMEASERAVMSPRVQRGAAPVKKSLGGVLEAGAGYLSGGIPGLLSSLAAQRRRKEEADAAKAAATPLTAASGIPDKKPDEMARGGRARKGSQTPLINKAGPPRSLLESKACGGSPRKK